MRMLAIAGICLLAPILIAPPPGMAATDSQPVENDSLIALLTGKSDISDNTVQLSTGDLLVVAKRNIKVDINTLCVEVDRGTIALIKSEQGATMVRVLNDRHDGGARARSQGWLMKLAVGQELTVTCDINRMRAAFQDGIGRRLVREYPVPQVGYVRLSDANLQDNLINEPLVVSFRRQNQVGKQRRLVFEMIKTTAIYNLFVRAGNPYTRSAIQ